MTVRIESKVQRGEHAGNVQRPHLHQDGFYVVSPTKFESDYIRVTDILSVANAAAAGLRVRMKADRQNAAGLVKPEALLIDGNTPSVWQARKQIKEGR